MELLGAQRHTRRMKRKKTQRLQGLSYMRMKKLDTIFTKMGLLDSQKPVLLDDFFLYDFLLQHFHQTYFIPCLGIQ